MANNRQSEKRYDLEDRTLTFAKEVRALIKRLPKSQGNFEDCKQLIRSSGSVGANYIEANEALSKKDFLMRAKICRKEAKESVYWLKLVDVYDDANIESVRMELQKEAVELTSIFGAIVTKSE